ncbi:MAG: HAMP domain-containing protein [Planctomycetota bacterium]|nr:MAG: HAMP domain-containing protein [Planctomycetota bacterium]
MRMSLRGKWAFYNVLATGGVLFVYAAVLYVQIGRHLQHQADASLMEEVEELVEEVQVFGGSSELETRLERLYARHGDYSFQIFAPDATPFFTSPILRYIALPTPPNPGDLHGPQWRDLRLSNLGNFRMVEMAARDGDSRPWLFRALVSKRYLERELAFYRWAIISLVGVTLVLAAVVGVGLARPMLGPIRRLSRMAQHVAQEQLSEPLPIERSGDELETLATTIRYTLERLAAALQAIQRFTGDAAHELRSPLAALRAEIEIALRHPRSEKEYCCVLQRSLVEVERLCAIVDQLLLLSKYDAGVLRPQMEPVDAAAVLKDVVQRWRAAAREKQIEIELDVGYGQWVFADRILLGQLFSNLIDNAIKFSSPGCTVSVHATDREGKLVVTVRDDGVGMDAETLRQACQRFYRARAARSHGHGFGLGLAISRSVAELFGGELEIASSGAGQGTTVCVRLTSIACENQPRSSHHGSQ